MHAFVVKRRECENFNIFEQKTLRNVGMTRQTKSTHPSWS